MGQNSDGSTVGDHQFVDAQQHFAFTRNVVAPQYGAVQPQMMPIVAFVQPQAPPCTFGAVQEQGRPRSWSNTSTGTTPTREVRFPDAHRPSTSHPMPIMQQQAPVHAP